MGGLSSLILCPLHWQCGVLTAGPPGKLLTDTSLWEGDAGTWVIPLVSVSQPWFPPWGGVVKPVPPPWGHPAAVTLTKQEEPLFLEPPAQRCLDDLILRGPLTQRETLGGVACRLLPGKPGLSNDSGVCARNLGGARPWGGGQSGTGRDLGGGPPPEDCAPAVPVGAPLPDDRP